MRKGSPRITLRHDTFEWRVLNFLEEVGDLILEAWLPKQYPETRLWRTLLGIDHKKKFSEKERQKLKFLISDTLFRLKRKGLVEKAGATRNAKWQISNAGQAVLHQEKKYMVPEDGRLRIFIFDVPEDQKKDREWLRVELIASGFLMLQKSAWIGKRPLPETFFQELAERGLFEAVHIFEVKDPGTLSNLDWRNLDERV
jgi:DNA-binding transcriptional regulator PaaX